MRTLVFVDYAIIAAYILLCIVIGIYFTKRAGKSVNDYFIGGRSIPWWLIGTSMAATNFSSDTPLAITKYIFQEGIAGVWFFWAGSIQAVLAAFLFAQLWRRSEVMTDAEIVEKRYSGKSSSFLRLFKGFYFGVLLNCVVMGWVFKGLIKIMTGVTTLDTMQVIVIFTALVMLYTIASGFYGTVWTDFFQYFIALAGCCSLAYYSVQAAGGTENMVIQINSMYGTGSGITQFYPTWPQAEQWMPLSVFFTYLGVQWWANKYADGGGKHIQRMLSAKSERDSVLATFFFTFMTYVIQVWPWILTALAALVIFGRDVKDPEMTYPMMMAKVLPSGVLGLMLIAAISAFMSTISTHLNLGGSYLVNDIYRRFLVKNGSEKHYVLVSRLATLLTTALAISVALYIESIGNAWKFVLAFTSGAGLTWILRWFWWRINAWSEISAMVTSGLTTIYIELNHRSWLYSEKIGTIVTLSTLVWLTVTFLTKPADKSLLKAFVNKVRPSSFGWKPIYRELGIRPTFRLRIALSNWLVALVFLFCLNFGIGNILLRDRDHGILQLFVAGICFVYLLWRITKKTRRDLPSVAEQELAPAVSET